MKETLQKNPTLAIIVIISAVLNVVLGFKAIMTYNVGERLTKIETTLDNIQKSVDRLEGYTYKVAQEPNSECSPESCYDFDGNGIIDSLGGAATEHVAPEAKIRTPKPFTKARLQ